jgi:hypothetical protein
MSHVMYSITVSLCFRDRCVFTLLMNVKHIQTHVRGKESKRKRESVCVCVCVCACVRSTRTFQKRYIVKGQLHQFSTSFSLSPEQYQCLHTWKRPIYKFCRKTYKVKKFYPRTASNIDFQTMMREQENDPPPGQKLFVGFENPIFFVFFKFSQVMSQRSIF